MSKRLKIAVYAICKNEIDFIERFYNSVRQADYIVILDTGSTDDTYRVLQSLTEFDARVIVEQKQYSDWRFDVARNDAFALCPKDTDVFVSVDLDEVFSEGWTEELRKNWRRGVHTRAEYWYVWSHNADGSEGRKFRYNKIHDQIWRWKYPVHELLAKTDTGSEIYSRDEALILPDNIVLHHYPDMQKSRASYLGLLEKRYKEYGDFYGMLYYGHENYYRHNYKECVEILSEALNKFSFDRLEEASSLLFIADSYNAMRETSLAKNYYLRAIKTYPVYFEPYYYLAKLLYGEGRLKECADWLRQGLSCRVRNFSWLEREEAWHYQPWDLLSLACYYSGQRAESLIYAIKAYSMAKNDVRLRSNIDNILKNINEKEIIYIGGKQNDD